MEQWLQSLTPWGTDVILWAQSLSSGGWDGLFTFLTFLGYEEFYLILLPFVYWCLDKGIGASLGYVSLLSVWVNSVLKYLFAIPRPADARMEVPRPETSPSFPSGHAQNAVVNWGYLAFRFRNWIFTAVVILLILGIGLSRIVLGVHYPQDVLAGWLIGLALLVIFVWLEPKVAAWIGRQAPQVQYALALGIPLLLIFIHPADVQGRYPAEGAVSPLSALAGLGVGLLMERRWVRFEARGVWWKRLLRFLTGLVVIAILYVGPKLVLPQEMAYPPEVMLRFLRYGLLGWAVAFLCPWLFVRLRLAQLEGG